MRYRMKNRPDEIITWEDAFKWLQKEVQMGARACSALDEPNDMLLVYNGIIAKMRMIESRMNKRDEKKEALYAD